MLSGIGGAALFIPIFVIIFPILGPDYPLTTAAAIGTALMTEVFGFSSGFVGYYRKRLIDFRSAIPFIRVAVPVAIAGALMLALLKEQETFLKAAYAVLMIVLCPVILRHTSPPAANSENELKQDSPSSNSATRSITAKSGETYRYPVPRVGFFGLFYTSGSADFRRRRQRHPLECGLLYDSGGHYWWPDRSLAARPYRPENDGKSDCYIVRHDRRGHDVDRDRLKTFFPPPAAKLVSSVFG